ncbi:MAG TPA: thioredoxin domain-containing protein [Pseudolabrys sp.]|nr:thioredoxin domain-containing protein [Pseudolabrys sp.]
MEIESQIDKLPGIVSVGNRHGDVTLVEFYDVNCPFCRAASPDIEAMLKSNPELRLILVPLPMLGIPSIQRTRGAHRGAAHVGARTSTSSTACSIKAAAL